MWCSLLLIFSTSPFRSCKLSVSRKDSAFKFELFNDRYYKNHSVWLQKIYVPNKRQLPSLYQQGLHFQSDICIYAGLSSISRITTNNCTFTPHFTVLSFYFTLKTTTGMQLTFLLHMCWMSDRMTNHILCVFCFNVLYYTGVQNFPNMNKGTETNMLKIASFFAFSHAQATNLMPHHQCY